MTDEIATIVAMSRTERRAHLLKMRELYVSENLPGGMVDPLLGQSSAVHASYLDAARTSARVRLTVAEILWGACDDTLRRDGTYRVVRGAEAICKAAADARLAEIAPRNA